MATTDSTTEVPRYEVFQELAAELQVQLPGVYGAKMAEFLLRFEDGRDLVGVLDGGTRVVYYEVASRSLVAVRFDKHGIYEGKQELLQRGLDDPGAWVEAAENDLLWIHPRYSVITA